MRRPITLVSLAALATAGFSTAAFAHIGDHSHMSFSEGLLHPFSGLDHVLAMVAVGLWASQLGGRALWLLPLTFPVVMAVGAALGFGGVSLAWIEIGIALSVVALGALVAFRARPSLAVSVPLIGLFALLHGYSHGVELPAEASALSYAAGFIAATARAAPDRHRAWAVVQPPAGPLRRPHRRRRHRRARRGAAGDALADEGYSLALKVRSSQPSITAAMSLLFFSTIIMWLLPLMPWSASRMKVGLTPACSRNFTVQWS